MNKKNKYQFLICISTVICLFSCVTNKTPGLYWHGNQLPGVIKLNDTLYYDESEVAVIQYRLYLFWLKHMYGENSEEFRQAQPDQSVWLRSDTCLVFLTEYYLYHPQYDFYPIVGITQAQAEKFSQWRSEMVFRRMLIYFGKIKEDTAENPQTRFTIEKFYAGKYQGMQPDSSVIYYPEYRLPSAKEWRLAVKYSDSVVKRFARQPDYPNVDYTPCLKSNQNADPTDKVRSRSAVRRRHEPFYNLRGNVSEWTSEKDVSVGGGWADKNSILAVQDTFHSSSTNAWTGFRNVCQWKVHTLAK